MFAVMSCLGRMSWVNLSGGQFDKESKIHCFISSLLEMCPKQIITERHMCKNVIVLFGIATELIIPSKSERI